MSDNGLHPLWPDRQAIHSWSWFSIINFTIMASALLIMCSSRGHGLSVEEMKICGFMAIVVLGLGWRMTVFFLIALCVLVLGRVVNIACDFFFG